MKFKRLLVVLVSVLFLQSCGLKFWYNRLDWVVAWRVDEYVELTDKQEEQLEALVREKLQWHRTTQLPRYVALIKELEADLGTERIVEKYHDYQDSFIDFYKTAAKELTPGLVNQISHLSDSQIQELMKNLTEIASERKQDYQKRSPEKRLKRVKENIIDGFEDWAGKLTKKQKGLIGSWTQEMQTTAELRFEYGNNWRVAMELALQNRTSAQGQETIKELILNPSSIQSIELKSRSDSNQILEKQYIIQLHNSMTKKQKKRFLRKLKSYREDFEDLVDD